MVGENAAVQYVHADGRSRELADKGQAAKMVDVAVGDEDMGNGFQADGFVELVGNGRSAIT